MSSFVVGTDHIDYLVSAVLVYAPLRLGGRTPDELGRQFLAENVATVTAHYLAEEDMDEDDMEDEEVAEMVEERATYAAMISRYAFREAELVEPAQAIWVAACWQYQRERDGLYDFPETWVTADEVIAGALTFLGPDRLRDPAGPRTIENFNNADLVWDWHRESHAG